MRGVSIKLVWSRGVMVAHVQTRFLHFVASATALKLIISRNERGPRFESR